MRARGVPRTCVASIQPGVQAAAAYPRERGHMGPQNLRVAILKNVTKMGVLHVHY